MKLSKKEIFLNEISEKILEIARDADSMSNGDLQGVCEAASRSIFDDVVKLTQCQDVLNWHHKQYGGELEEGEAFIMETQDARTSNGQFTVNLSPESGKIDDIMSVVVQVDRLPGSRTDIQAAKVYFDADNLAFTAYKEDEKYIIVLAENVRRINTRLSDGTSVFILE